MSDKVFLISGVDQLRPSSELKCVTIEEKDNKRLFLFDSNVIQFYEFVKQNNNFRSFFVNNSVISDGDLYVCTHFDWLFIVLPFLTKKRQQFHSIYEILSEIFDKEISHKLQISSKCQTIGLISDIKYICDEMYVRYNDNKAMDWLKSKIDNTIDALINNNINVLSNGCKVSGYRTGREDPNGEKVEFTKIAFELISHYLNDEISADLRNHLSLPQDITESNESLVSETRLKRKNNEMESSIPLEDYSSYSYGTKTSGLDVKRSKMTKSHKELLKVDKTGMKSISTFFKPKPK